MNDHPKHPLTDLAGQWVTEERIVHGTVTGHSEHWDPIGDVVAFHEKFGLEYNGKPRALTGELLQFRGAFMQEEAREWLDEGVTLEARLNEGTPEDADITHHLEMQLDAIIDELYVVLGAAYLQGFTRDILVRAWRRVHAANMAKVRAERASDSKRGSTFDVVKPAGWTPPKHTDLVEDHAHRTQLLPPPDRRTDEQPDLFAKHDINPGSDGDRATLYGVDYGSGDLSAETVVERTPSGGLRLVSVEVQHPNIRPVSMGKLQEAVEPINEALYNSMPLCERCGERHDHTMRCGEIL